MLERLVGPVPQLFIQEPVTGFLAVPAVEDRSALPDRARRRELALHRAQHGFAVKPQIVAHAVQELERAAYAEPDLEAGVAKSVRESVHRALRRRVRQD